MTPALTLDDDGIAEGRGPRRRRLRSRPGAAEPRGQARRPARVHRRDLRHLRLASSALDILPAGSRLQIVNENQAVFDSGDGDVPGDVGTSPVGDTGWSVRVTLDQGATLTALPVVLLAGGSLALVLLVGVLFAEANQRRRQRDRSQRRLQHLADTDGLTGLANRRRLERDLAAAVAAATEDEPLALMFLDLNGFKGYNDRFGHPAGDALLVRLSARLSPPFPGAASTGWAATSSACSPRCVRPR